MENENYALSNMRISIYSSHKGSGPMSTVSIEGSHGNTNEMLCELLDLIDPDYDLVVEILKEQNNVGETVRKFFEFHKCERLPDFEEDTIKDLLFSESCPSSPKTRRSSIFLAEENQWASTPKKEESLRVSWSFTFGDPIGGINYDEIMMNIQKEGGMREAKNEEAKDKIKTNFEIGILMEKKEDWSQIYGTSDFGNGSIGKTKEKWQDFTLDLGDIEMEKQKMHGDVEKGSFVREKEEEKSRFGEIEVKAEDKGFLGLIDFERKILGETTKENFEIKEEEKINQPYFNVNFEPIFYSFNQIDFDKKAEPWDNLTKDFTQFAKNPISISQPRENEKELSCMESKDKCTQSPEPLATKTYTIEGSFDNHYMPLNFDDQHGVRKASMSYSSAEETHERLPQTNRSFEKSSPALETWKEEPRIQIFENNHPQTKEISKSKRFLSLSGEEEELSDEQNVLEELDRVSRRIRDSKNWSPHQKERSKELLSEAYSLLAEIKFAHLIN